MNEAEFAKVVKELTAVAELIRTRQDEKQSILKEFLKEKQRFKSGKISRKAFSSSTKKVNKELSKLDNSIKQNIKNVKKVSDRIKKIAGRQVPKHFRVVLTGIKNVGGKKKRK
jgi:uncharacterized protein YukE